MDRRSFRGLAGLVIGVALGTSALGALAGVIGFAHQGAPAPTLVDAPAREWTPTQARYRQADPAGVQAGDGRFGYAEQSPLQFVDPLGLWSKAVHHQILRERFQATLASEALQMVIQGSDEVDSLWNQFFGNDYEHAMRNDEQSVAEAKAKACMFIRFHMNEFRRKRNTLDWREAYKHLGRALHPVMDSTSPAHKGWPVWRLRDFRSHGNFGKSTEAWIHPDDMARTIDLISRTLNGDDCACTL